MKNHAQQRGQCVGQSLKLSSFFLSFSDEMKERDGRTSRCCVGVQRVRPIRQVDDGPCSAPLLPKVECMRVRALLCPAATATVVDPPDGVNACAVRCVVVPAPTPTAVILCIFGTHTYWSRGLLHVYVFCTIIPYEIMSKLAFKRLCDQFGTVR